MNYDHKTEIENQDGIVEPVKSKHDGAKIRAPPTRQLSGGPSDLWLNFAKPKERPPPLPLQLVDYDEF